MKRIILIVGLFILTACSSNYSGKYSKGSFGRLRPPAVYYVRKGDTLFSIAWRYGLDPHVIQRRNGLTDPNKISVGQPLRLKYSTKRLRYHKRNKSSPHKVASVHRTPKVIANWVWPIKGRIVRNFNPKKIGANGIRIAGRPNQTVNAAEKGVVAYKGNGLNGYGNVVIIKHKSGLLSAYGFLSKTYVKEGQTVKKRQRIGTVGYAANKQLMLHFEVRRNGHPVNPKAYIGNRYRF
ncbi:MAG: peptidase M23 [Gammaproteobacteria bacterium]|nr:MAG: peptidase M23 [Gammaproteobacteria bacterium]